MGSKMLRSRWTLCRRCTDRLLIPSLFSQCMKPSEAINDRRSLERRCYSQGNASSHTDHAEIAHKQIGALKKNTHVKPVRPRSDYRFDTLFTELLRASKELCSRQTPPTEAEILHFLGDCLHLAKMLPKNAREPPMETQSGAAASALLDLDGMTERQDVKQKRSQAVERLAEKLANISHSTITEPSIFLSLRVLQQYTTIQACLSKPETLPEAFELFGNKPVPQEGSSPIKYIKSNPKKLSNAIPPELADQALQVAIQTKDMLAAINIIETTYGSTAYKRAKLLRKAMIPAACLALAPIGAWSIAEKLSLLQTSWEQGTATRLVFVGLLAYIGFTGTIGVVALTTANDQMERVTWAAGVPLRERWMREEERAAFDKIAMAWGFREHWRRGEEEGEEWDALREWINDKGMILDKVELMEGMG